MVCLLALSLAGCYEYRGPYTRADVEEYLTGRYPDETINIRQEGLQLDSVKKYYAFYQLPCDEFSQTELDEYAVNAWPWTPKPRVRQGEEVLPPELFTGIGLESGVISYGGLYVGKVCKTCSGSGYLPQ